MTSVEFERAAAAAIRRLPRRIRGHLDNVSFAVEDSYRGRDDLLGLYQGVAAPRRGLDYSGALPDRITLFRRAIEQHAAQHREPVEAVIYETVLHEVGHHLGFEEHELEALEKRRLRRIR